MMMSLLAFVAAVPCPPPCDALRSRVNPDLANALSDLRDGDLQPPAWFGVHDKPGFKKPRQR